MIEPLRNIENFGSPDEAEAARLLRAVGPAAPLPVVEQRVFASLARPRRFGPRALRLASVASVSLVTTGILAMTMNMVLPRHADTRPQKTQTLAPLPQVSSPEPVVVAAPVAPVVPQPTPVVMPETPTRAEPRIVSHPGPRPVLAGRHRVQATEETGGSVEPAAPPAPAVDNVESTEARVAAAPPEEAALVLAGLRALRRQHDPIQAGVLLTRYLTRFPQGTLVQEALAIAIEAGLARGDRPAAAQLAQQYLEGFPAGRFTRLARKAIGSTGP